MSLHPPSELQPPVATVRRFLLPLLLAYPVLAITGDLTHRQIFPLLALLLLATAAMLPRLLARRAGAWLIWVAVLVALVLSSLFKFADLVLEGVPVLICGFLAIGFGRTLATPEPLIAHFIVALDGEARLAQPGVAQYAREVTWGWTVLLATQALVLALLLLCAEHVGVLARLGLTPPFAVPDRWAAAWLHVGGYLMLAVAFGVEYTYRRWRLRHLSHTGLHTMLLNLIKRWPELMQAKSAPATGAPAGVIAKGGAHENGVAP
jgi:uncharacterized membrane protein